MRSKKVSRHYCDFCSKGSFQIPSMQKHESRCCRNPKRACGVCDCGQTDVEANANILIKDGINALITATDRCPACMLAAHIMANKILGLSCGDVHPEDQSEFFYYVSFREDLKNWMDEKRREEISQYQC